MARARKTRPVGAAVAVKAPAPAPTPVGEAREAQAAVADPAPQPARTEPDLLSAAGAAPLAAARAPAQAADLVAEDVAALMASGVAWVRAAERVSLVMLDLASGAIAGGLETQRAWRDFVSVEDAMRAQASRLAQGVAATLDGAGSIMLAAAEVAERSTKPWLGRIAARTGWTP